jgi:hypothetical protein
MKNHNLNGPYMFGFFKQRYNVIPVFYVFYRKNNLILSLFKSYTIKNFSFTAG